MAKKKIQGEARLSAGHPGSQRKAEKGSSGLPAKSTRNSLQARSPL